MAFDFDTQKLPTSMVIARVILAIQAVAALMFGVLWIASGALNGPGSSLSLGPIAASGILAVAIGIAFIALASLYALLFHRLAKPTRPVIRTVYAVEAFQTLVAILNFAAAPVQSLVSVAFVATVVAVLYRLELASTAGQTPPVETMPAVPDATKNPAP